MQGLSSINPPIRLGLVKRPPAGYWMVKRGMNTRRCGVRNYELIAQMVKNEIDRQDIKWDADRRQHPFVWNAILTEEVGEFAQAALQSGYGGKHAGTELEEIIQVAAVAMQIANDLVLESCGRISENGASHE